MPNRTVRVALSGLVLPVAGLLAGCAGDDSSGSSAAEPTATVTVTETTAASENASPTPAEPPPPPARFPCDPGGGFPKPAASCPYGNPLTGSVTAFDGSSLTIEPFHTYYNDAEGKAYARKHHLRYPFDDDHYDAPDGPARTITVSPDTLCTGIIAVGYRDPMKDRLVPCSAYVKAVSRFRAVTSALWFDGDRLVQLSELFRP